jgi:hypothetical protein
MRLAAPHAAAAAIIVRRVRAWLGLVGACFNVPLDAYHWQNNHGRGLIQDIRATETDNAPLFGEFDDVAHQPFSSPPVRMAPSARTGIRVIKRHARLTLR